MIKLKSCNKFEGILIVFLTLFTFFLTSCGSGSGGGGGTTSSDIYTGKTEQATITADNAKTLAVEGYKFGNSPSSTSSSSKPENDTNVLLSFMPSEAVLEKILNVSTSQTDSGTQNGTCGGTLSYTITTTQQSSNSYSFSGTYTYSSYCTKGIYNTTVNGTTNISGSMTTDSQGLLSALTMTMSMSDFSVTVGNDSYAFTGSFSFSIDSSTKTITSTASFSAKDPAGKTYKVENLNMTVVTSSASAATFTTSGKIYDSDYGYVTVSTPTPFNISGSSLTAGVMVFTGANNTKAKLTALSNGTQFTVEADINGDDVYETNIGTFNWADV